jgi:hypothetical protein
VALGAAVGRGRLAVIELRFAAAAARGFQRRLVGGVPYEARDVGVAFRGASVGVERRRGVAGGIETRAGK